MAKLIILRHAERPEIDANGVGNDVLLTDRGKRDAYLFGKNIGQPVIKICSSPIGRCMQTAEIVAEASDCFSKEIIQDRDLGDPGFIIEDGDEAWTHWQSKGQEAVNQHLLSGSEKWSGFFDLDEASTKFSEKIFRYLVEQEKGIHIWVTHDTVLATFASRVLGSPLSIQQWPYFLDYLSINIKENGLEYHYFNRGEK